MVKGYWEKIGFDVYLKDYLKRLKGNEIVWTKRDSEITFLTYWKKPFLCESCGKETHLTSRGYPYLGMHLTDHAVCEECYKELHAYHIAVAPKLLKEWSSGR